MTQATQEQKDQILKLWYEGKTITQIGFAVGMDVWDVRQVTESRAAARADAGAAAWDAAWDAAGDAPGRPAW